MAPIKPHWSQPSHGDVQEVIVNEAAFTSKSLCKVHVAPFGLFAKMSFPPCTMAEEPTYATVQIGREKHLNLNSDLLYINHSCDPSLMIDTASLAFLAGPKGLRPGDELTFFYPSTEYAMAQGFDCLCGTSQCKGRIDGAGRMSKDALKGMWLSAHIREMLEEKDGHPNGAKVNGRGDVEKTQLNGRGHGCEHDKMAGVMGQGNDSLLVGATGRSGPTSRELSGEMGGDTQ